MPSSHFPLQRRSSCDSICSESVSVESVESIEMSSSSTSSCPSAQPSPPPYRTSSASQQPAVEPLPSTNRIKKRKFHSDFEDTLHNLARPLLPFVNNDTGAIHPEFPRTPCAFNLLTSDQLDSLARHYHQVWPAQPPTNTYPHRVRPWVGAPDESCIDLATKRQRFGHFIGMPGYLEFSNSALPIPQPMDAEGRSKRRKEEN
ncbi:uncharacterized protein N7482_008722 [Penicillium canariense]|uniref:Uncharacterized protein n=1 Tax=Penicillium canariense TaxID=189055 RepID=A0A9W9HUF3_9EURO|nr:uncharacterized protein N7482_008722 [Penicillium canariense]KAJ5157622.1 hypothetical protein N7482_008722 [Penicillium canariense]